MLLVVSGVREGREESENLMESFLQSGNRNVEQFMEEYQEKRKLAHLRRIKVEKMKELLQQGQDSGGSSSTPSRPAPLPPLPYPGYNQQHNANLPYPNLSYSNMPMP